MQSVSAGESLGSTLLFNCVLKIKKSGLPKKTGQSIVLYATVSETKSASQQEQET